MRAFRWEYSMTRVDFSVINSWMISGDILRTEALSMTAGRTDSGAPGNNTSNSCEGTGPS
jgi:hypothetical protein